MPPIQSRTREDIRLAVGYNLQAVFEGSTTSTSAGATDLIDTKLRGGTGDHNGKWVIITSGDRDGDTSQVTAYNTSTNTLTVSPAFGGTLASGVSYELWEREFRPQAVHNWLNQSIDFVAGKAHDPEEEYLHLESGQYRYPIPSTMTAGISKLERRVSFQSVQIDNCDSGWTAGTGITLVHDDQRKQQGSASLRMVVNSASYVASTNMASKTIGSVNLSQYDTVEFWCLTNSAFTSAIAALNLRLTSGSDTVTVSLPDTSANIPTYHRVTITPANAMVLTGVTGLAFRWEASLGRTFWFDDIKAVVNDSAQWAEIPHEWWWIDTEAQEIVFRPEWGPPPYELLRITGGDLPALLTTDSTVCEVDPYFVIAKATELGLMSNPQYGSPAEEAAWRNRVAYWSTEAMKRVRSFPPKQNWRDTR